MRRCGNCRFLHGPVDHCRRNPPRALSDQQSAFAPVDPKWEGCGEHRYDWWRKKLKKLGYLPAGSFVPPPPGVVD